MSDSLITFFASLLVWILFIGLFVLWVVDGKIKKEQVLHGILAFVLAWVLADVLKGFFPTVRPFLINNNPALVLFPGDNPAFPSGHAASSFALAMTIFKHDKKVGSVYIILAILISVARVAANVHYPIDVFGGAILGILVANLVRKIHLTSST